MAARGTLDKLKIAELQQYLVLHGLPKSGKKPELVARVEYHLAKQAMA